MKYIKKIILKNFGKFKYLEIDFDEKLNVLIGDITPIFHKKSAE